MDSATLRRTRRTALAVTASMFIEDRLRVLHARYQLCVPTPVEPDELRARVAWLIGMDRSDDDSPVRTPRQGRAAARIVLCRSPPVAANP